MSKSIKDAAQALKKAFESEATELTLDNMELSELPESLGQLTQLQSLSLNNNQLTALPKSLGKLTQLQSLSLNNNQLTALPKSLGKLTQIERLELNHNQLTSLPESLGKLTQIERLELKHNLLTTLPESLGQLRQLRILSLSGNRIADLPESLYGLKFLEHIELDDDPLNSELAAAYADGQKAVQQYLRAKTQTQAVLNEAKLILVGEGEVGKSCLLAALRGDLWEEGRPSTHGIEIKPVVLANPDNGNRITLNGWDFGGQRVYRPTHQLFFSSPAVYLVVWKPREGARQASIKDWIRLVKHREPDAKILVVATHGGPKERQPDIDRQEIWDLFGHETVLDFFHVESKPDEATGERRGISELQHAIARTAADLPGVGMMVSEQWVSAREALRQSSAAYLSFQDALAQCETTGMDEEAAKYFIRISHRLGRLIHYESSHRLREIVILKPDWLSTAIGFALEDEQIRANHGYVNSERLGKLWHDPNQPDENRYPRQLHEAFIELMERFDIFYRVTEPQKAHPEGAGLIAQLVPDTRPDIAAVWPQNPAPEEKQQVRVCQIVDEKGQSAAAEGLFYQLIVRFHKYSLGRDDFRKSVHWQRGLVLEDTYNGRALLEHIGNNVHITVRAPYPESLLSVLMYDLEWLVESFWPGLTPLVMVPCLAPCGKGRPGTGLFEVKKLIAFKSQGMQNFPCMVPGCFQTHNIDNLLGNTPARSSASIAISEASDIVQIKKNLAKIRASLSQYDMGMAEKLERLDENDRRIMSQVDDAFTGLMQALTDEAKDGPRLFSFEPIEPSFWDRPKWISAKFRVTLWCEHTRLPLPLLNSKNEKSGVYDVTMPREWLVKAAPFLKMLAGTLSLVLPVAGSMTTLTLNDAVYKRIDEHLALGQKTAEALLKGSEKAHDWVKRGDAPDLEHIDTIEAQGAVLRQLHAWLKDKDPSYSGLVRVQNKRREFLWVHPQYVGEY